MDGDLAAFVFEQLALSHLPRYSGDWELSTGKAWRDTTEVISSQRLLSMFQFLELPGADEQDINRILSTFGYNGNLDFVGFDQWLAESGDGWDRTRLHLLSRLGRKCDKLHGEALQQAERARYDCMLDEDSVFQICERQKEQALFYKALSEDLERASQSIRCAAPQERPRHIQPRRGEGKWVLSVKYDMAVPDWNSSGGDPDFVLSKRRQNSAWAKKTYELLGSRRCYNPNDFNKEDCGNCRCRGLPGGCGMLDFDHNGVPSQFCCWRASYRWHLEVEGKMLQIKDGKWGGGQLIEMELARELGIKPVCVEIPMDLISMARSAEDTWHQVGWRMAKARHGLRQEEIDAAKQDFDHAEQAVANFLRESFQRLGVQ